MAPNKPADAIPIESARASKQQLKDELIKTRQRCLDQETTIDTMRKLFVAIILKHGTLGTLHLVKADIEVIGTTGDLKIREMPTGIVLAARVAGAQPGMVARPMLVRK